ncbi:hypothetical protein ASG76_02290 [Nocardioides sp. Soil774]|nr:hypothetical protein ASG76_02290 [Nocardioides sp. Soil774]
MVGRRAEYSPLRRVVALLEELTRVHEETRGYGALTDADLMSRVQAYGAGAHAAKTLRNDKKALRERGLVVTNVPVRDEPHLRGTARSPMLEKSPDWHLTEDEHLAVQCVREDLRRRHVDVGPTDAPPDERRSCRVDEALRLVRLLEEHEGDVEVEVVAAALRVGPRQAARWLTELAAGFDAVEVTYTRDEDDLTLDDLVSARMRRTSADPDHPLSRTGTDLLGLFPYSRPEVDERLNLLADYAEAVARGDVTKPVGQTLLDSVRWKLESWRDFLTTTLT